MTGLLGAPLPRGYDQPRPSPSPCDTFAAAPRAWLAQLAIETRAPSAYARRQAVYERMIEAADLGDSD